MVISEIFAFLIGPHRGSQEKPIMSGTRINLSGELFEHLSDLFRKSQTDCNVEVALTSDGPQENQFRNALIPFVMLPTLANAEPIAVRLAMNTTHRSRLGLLFLIYARNNQDSTVLLSRFPTDTAIHVQDDAGSIDVKFLDKVFVKNYQSYKAALFSGKPVKGDFWKGHVIDRQINSHHEDASKYWVHDFLSADFILTSMHGTHTFARAIQDASARATLDEKIELHHLAGMVPNMDGMTTSVVEILEKYNVSETARQKVLSKIHETVAKQHFKFSREHFNSVISFRTVETNEGAILTAESSKFEKVFRYERISSDGRNEIVRLTTEGMLTADKLRRSK